MTADTLKTTRVLELYQDFLSGKLINCCDLRISKKVRGGKRREFCKWAIGAKSVR